MPGLLFLPTEILQEIGSRTAGKELKEMRAVNRQLQLALEPIYFKSMRMNTGRYSQLEALATQATRAALYVQHLEIINATRAGPNELAERDITLYLESALCKFKTLQSLKWHTGLDNSDTFAEAMVHQCVSDCLGPLQTIKALEVIVHSIHVPNLGLFENLEKFSIQVKSSLPTPETLTNVAREVVHNNPHLTAICLDAPESSTVDLEKIFPRHEVPLGLGHLSLSVLRISGVCALAHLQSLHSLRISDIFIKDDIDAWTTLQSERMWMQKLQVSSADGSLMDYLSSFSTLECLSITFRRDKSDEEHVEKFLYDILPRHAESLDSLTLRARWACIWEANGARNLANLGRCRELILELPLSSIKHDGGDTLTTLLDYTDDFHHLECLTLLIYGYPPMRDSSLNAKIRTLNAIARVRAAQRIRLLPRGSYVIQVQCGSSIPLQYKQ